MKKFKTIGLSLLIAVCAVCLSLAFVACSGGERNANYGAGEEGFYYYDGANSARYMLSLQSGTYMITAGGETQYSGSYSYDEESGEISFDGGNFSAMMGDNALSLDVSDSGYSFKAYKYFDVTYVDENGVNIATESVLNGQSAKAITVEKDGYWFIGWYEDSSNSSEFAFDTSIAGDTTVYGWYIEKNLTATEYEITLDYGDGTTKKVSTMNGAVWTLPSDGILGWWVSATNKSGELTYKYETGTAFTSDTTLFAVYSGIGASVTGTGITWENATGSDVTIAVYDENGSQVLYATPSSTSGQYLCDFTALSAGTYTVEVTSGSSSEILTYIANGLDRVSVSSYSIVVNGDGRVLSFAPVDNAVGYTITIDDGEKVVTEDLGSRTYYNLSSWEMTETGLTITVTAYADGYVSSVSDEYSYLLKLDSVVIEMSGDDFSWNRVDGALEYEVIVYGEDEVEVLESFYTTDTSYSLKYYGAGMYTISVKPVTNGYWSTETFIHGQTKSTIAAPVITDITDYTITWSEVAEAASYVVMINGEPYEVTEGTTLAFGTTVPTDASSYEIAVMAVAEEDGEWDSSSYSDTVTATNGGFKSSVTYEKNTVTWNYDVSATSYVVSVNGTETTVVGANSAEITLNKAGNNEIVVTAYSDGAVLGQASIDVYAYVVTLDPNGAAFEDTTATTSTIYVAQGDVLNLGKVTKTHAEFVSWYTQADYTDGQSDSYEGKGSEVVSGSVFTGSRDMYLYAYWSYEYIDVTLYVGTGVYAEMQIKYNSTSFVLPTVDSSDPENSFVGWFTGANGAGIQCTTYDGVYTGSGFGDYNELFAYFLPILSYERTRYNGEVVYSVSVETRTNISRFTGITIPEYYTVVESGTAVNYGIVINSGAFENCTTLETINIPDTIQYIAVTNDGYRAGSGAFAGCSSLANVNIYSNGNATEPLYFSEDGVLFKKTDDSESGDAELIYYPYARDLTAYTVPSVVYNENEYDTDNVTLVAHTVTTIPSQVFRNRKLSSVTFPSTITTISFQAFYSNTELTTVVFEEGGNAPLSIDDYAFKDCTALTSVTIPSRYAEFNPNAFVECTVLENIYVGGTGGNYQSYDGILLDSIGTTLVYMPMARAKGDIDISAVAEGTISKIGKAAFAYNTKITSVVISEPVTEIGESAFEGCTGITSVTFKGTAQSGDLTIKENAFYGLRLLTEVVLPCNLVKMEENAFGGCGSLTYVYFDSTTDRQNRLNFAEGSFGTSSAVTTLVLGANVPAMDFVNIFAGENLAHVTIEAGNANYSSDDYGVVYDAGMTSIYYYPFGRVGEYVIPDTVQQITADTFANRTGLTSLTIGEGVNTIAQDAFSSCTYLETIYVNEKNENFTSDENGILYGIAYSETGEVIEKELIYCPLKNTVQTLVLDETVVKTSKNAFYGNTSVTSVTFTGSALDLGAYSFYGCSALTTVVLPDSMTSIPDYAFYNCTKLFGISIPSSVESIGNYAFWTCTSLTGDLTDEDTGIVLPDGLETVGERAFYNDKLLAVTIPVSVIEIKTYAFYGCWNDSTSSAEIVFAKTEEGATEPDLVLGTYAFGSTKYATKLEVPARLKSMDQAAFHSFGSSISSTIETPITFEEGTRLTELPTTAFYSASRLWTITIPKEITKINQQAFSNCSNLKTVDFNGTTSLTYIGSSAFRYTGLTSVEIPASVTEIDQYAFAVSSITSLTFENESKLETIGTYAFYQVGATEINIPASVTSIGDRAISNCTKLTKVTFQGVGEESSLTKLGNRCFYSCTALVDVELPAKLTETGSGDSSTSNNGIFESCSALASVTIPASVTTITTNTFRSCSSLAEVKFEDGCQLSYIGDNAFYGCKSLESFEFPESSATSIALGDTIFSGCTKLTSIHLSSSVNDIGGAFVGLSLDSLTVAAENTSYLVDEEGTPVLYNKNSTSIEYIFGTITSTELTIPETITSIGPSAFSGQKNIQKVTLPATLTTIGNYAFEGCTSLVEVVLTDGINLTDGLLGTHVFDGCSSLTTISIPSTITALPDYFFYGCTSLKTLTLPSSVTSLGSYSLYNTGITSIDLTNVIGIGTYALANTKSLVSVTLATGLAQISDYAFSASSVVSVALPTGLGSINQYAFYNCTSLTSIEIPNSVTTIGQHAFDGCSSLVDVVLPSNMQSLDSYVFQYCSSLKTVDLPQSLETLGTYAFRYCSSLEYIIFPESLTTVGMYCFDNTGIRYITMNDNLTTIGQNAFSNCPNLETVEIGHNVTSVGGSAFRSCTSLTYAYTGDSLDAIVGYMFQDDTALVEVEFGPYVKEMNTGSFWGCTALETLTLPNGLTKIDGENAFYGAGLKELYIPSTVTYVGYGTFWNCSCDIYIENTVNYVSSFWDANWNDGNSGTVYYYTQSEPAFTEDCSGYDGNYWYYDDDNNITVWGFGYTTCAIDGGGYVLYSEESDVVSYMCLYDADTDTYVVYSVTDCAGDTAGYTVTLEDGSVYTVVLSGTSATVTGTNA